MWFPSWGSGVYRRFESDAKNTRASMWDTGPCLSVGGQAISQESGRGSPGLQGQPVWTADGQEMPSQIRLGFPGPWDGPHPFPESPIARSKGTGSVIVPGKSSPSCFSLPWAFPCPAATHPQRVHCVVLQVSFHKLGHGTTQTVGSVHMTPAGLGQVHATWPRHPSHKDHCGKVLLFYWVQLRVGQSARLGKLLFTVSELLKEELPQDQRGSGPAVP